MQGQIQRNRNLSSPPFLYRLFRMLCHMNATDLHLEAFKCNLKKGKFTSLWVFNVLAKDIFYFTLGKIV